MADLIAPRVDFVNFDEDKVDGNRIQKGGKFVFTSKLRLDSMADSKYKYKYLLQKNNSNVITMHVNPNTVAWSQSKRISRRDVINGAEFFNFKDGVNGSNNDVLVLNFIGTSGYNSYNSMSNAFKVFRNLYSLSIEPILLPDGQTNYVHVTYRTGAVGSRVLTGFFETPLQFSETADAPFKIDYTFSFIVADSSSSDLMSYT